MRLHGYLANGNYQVTYSIALQGAVCDASQATYFTRPGDVLGEQIWRPRVSLSLYINFLC